MSRGSFQDGVFKNKSPSLVSPPGEELPRLKWRGISYGRGMSLPVCDEARNHNPIQALPPVHLLICPKTAQGDVGDNGRQFVPRSFLHARASVLSTTHKVNLTSKVPPKVLVPHVSSPRRRLCSRCPRPPRG